MERKFQEILKTPEQSPSQEILEKEIWSVLRILPQDLRARWTEKFDNAEDFVQFKQELDGFVKKREEVLLASVEVFPGNSETIKEEVRQVITVINRTFGDTNYFLGNGRTAEVYELPVAPHLCVKYIYNQDAYNEDNHLRVEYDFLCRLYALKEGNVRTPTPAFLRIHPSEGHVYGMEKVNGKSLSQILEKPDENRELIEVAQGLDRKEAKESFAAYVKKMHEQKVTHNDLFMRNIMLDKDGNFFLVDFGKAKYEELGEDREEERKRDMFLAGNEISLFFQKLDSLEIK